ncbi:MAG: site-specific integrase, partial [Chloroflexota bacterium]
MNARARQLDAFLDMLAAERGAARNTLDAYRRDLSDYIDFLHGRRRDPGDAATDDMRAWLADLDTRGMSTATVARRLSALRQFHKFLYVDRHRADDPAAALEGPRLRRDAPGVMSVAEVDRLLATAREGLDDEKRPLRDRLRAARLHALLETLYATGLRVSELVSLPKSAARTRDPFITIKGKGGRERLAPLTGAAKRALADYRKLVEAVAPALAEGPFLFPAD